MAYISLDVSNHTISRSARRNTKPLSQPSPSAAKTVRSRFADTVISLHNREDCFFLTGDLGFMALEGVREAFGDRFVNAGVAEQNMIGVAAGLARAGFRVFAYSIAPFCYARPFEQIRNDICMVRLPVCLVGNGGGYAYGHMGPTHHALEDCAVMAALGMRVLAPAFDADLPAMLSDFSEPTYLRLGYEIRPEGSQVPAYAPWRRLLTGRGGAVAALGPMAGITWQAFHDLPDEHRPSVWAVTEFAADLIPDQFWQDVSGKPLYVVEEHIANGGLGMMLSLALAQKNMKISRFIHRHALGYPSGRYGSQTFHRIECGLDAKGLIDMISCNQ
jgi:transketolase